MLCFSKKLPINIKQKCQNFLFWFCENDNKTYNNLINGFQWIGFDQAWFKFQVDQIGSKVDRHLAMRRDKDKMNSKMKNDNQEQQYVGSTKKINFGMLRLLETLTLISTRQNQKMEKIKTSIDSILRVNSSDFHNPQHARVKITDVSN